MVIIITPKDDHPVIDAWSNISTAPIHVDLRGRWITLCRGSTLGPSSWQMWIVCTAAEGKNVSSRSALPCARASESPQWRKLKDHHQTFDFDGCPKGSSLDHHYSLWTFKFHHFSIYLPSTPPFTQCLGREIMSQWSFTSCLNGTTRGGLLIMELMNTGLWSSMVVPSYLLMVDPIQAV